MKLDLINIGQEPNDGTGDPLRDGAIKVNSAIKYLQNTLKQFKIGEYLDEDKSPFYRVFKGVLYEFKGSLPYTVKKADIPDVSLLWERVVLIELDGKGKIKTKYLPDMSLDWVKTEGKRITNDLIVSIGDFDDVNGAKFIVDISKKEIVAKGAFLVEGNAIFNEYVTLNKRAELNIPLTDLFLGSTKALITKEYLHSWGYLTPKDKMVKVYNNWQNVTSETLNRDRGADKVGVILVNPSRNELYVRTTKTKWGKIKIDPI